MWQNMVDRGFFFIFKTNNGNAICDIPVVLMLYYGIKYPHQYLIFVLKQFLFIVYQAAGIIL